MVIFIQLTNVHKTFKKKKNRLLFCLKTTRILRITHTFGIMWRRIVLIIVIAGCHLTASAQSVEEMEKILLFYGVSSPEEVDFYEVEQLSGYLARPLSINLVTPSALSSSGLLTPYQVASLTDYRKRHGDVMSFEELASVDGFGKILVEKLRPFVSLSGRDLSAYDAGNDFYGEVDVKSGWKNSAAPTYGVKFKLKAGRQLSAGGAFSRSSGADEPGPDAFAGNLCYDFRKVQGKIIIGDFNARFGQGLALWNGLSLGGLSSPSSFLKRTSGISASSSFTGNYSLRGAAADFTIRNIKFSTLAATYSKKAGHGLTPALNLSFIRRNGVLSFTHYADFMSTPVALSIPDMKTSLDLAMCLHGTDVFAETAYDWVNRTIAALAGTVFPLNDDVRMAAMLRYYPSAYSSARSAAAASTSKCTNEYGASLSSEFLNGLLSLDAAYFPTAKSGDDTSSSLQVKIQSEWKIQVSETFDVKVRVSERLRSWGMPSRAEARADLIYMNDGWNVAVRADLVRSDGWGILGYAEAGRKAEDISIYIRYGMFRIDDWDDRIYVYERDAPGAFNVPAFYGRGVWGAINMGWRCSRSLRVYGRGAVTAYPFIKSKKSGRAELKLQIMYEF